MRIKKIRLSGFKSFVDSTTIEFSPGTIGIVGPNGCGKSNIMDAVRWVTGRGARNIRAGNVEDVIFNGTDTRKPAGQANVELIFDNEDGKIAGQYASYNEVSLKRVADRTRESKYSINSARCRQRDIADILFGTGLGAHSYALIEQGMITRIIEAEPKEMRLYLEEAAGISKYRERRRETEIRMRHTRDNLDRVMDIRDEVSKQISKLKRQARSAQRYKELRATRDQTAAGIAYLDLKQHQDAVAECERLLSDLGNAIEQKQAQLRQSEADVLTKQNDEKTCNQELNEMREKYYQLNAAIGGVEQDIDNRSQNAEQIQKEVQEVAKLFEKCQDTIAEQGSKREETLEQLKALEENYQACSAKLMDAEQQLKEQEIALDTLQREWEKQHATELDESLEVLRIKIEYCDREMSEIAKQEGEMIDQRSSLNLQELEAQMGESRSRRQAQREKIEENERKVQHTRNTLERMREDLVAAEKSSEQLQKEFQEMREEMASLKALQSAEGGDGFFRWLEGKKLSKASRLAAKISPDKQWEAAVETVLGNLLNAVEVQAIDEYTQNASELPTGMFVLYESHQNITGKDGTLASKVSADCGMNAMLNDILLADDLNSALAMRKNFTGQESAVTPEGFWVGRNWIRARRPSDKKESVLARQHILEDLDEKVKKCEERSQASQEKVGRLRQQISDNESSLERTQKESDELRAELAKADSQWRQDEVRLNHAKDVNAELEERTKQVAEWRQSIEVQRKEYIEKREALEEDAPEQGSDKSELAASRQQVAESRKALSQLKDEQHQAEIARQSLKNQLTSTDERLEHLRQQQEDLQQRQASLGNTERGFQDPIKERQSELQSMTEEREQVKQQVDEKTKQMDDIRLEIESLQGSVRQQTEANSKALEEREKGRMDLQKEQMLCDEIKGKIDELNTTPEAIAKDLAEDADADTLRKELDELEGKIERLGPINLIADQEFNELSDRKEYIDAQHSDLSIALETLEKAIVRIEKESKEKFKNTFEGINSHLKLNFQRLFGGGDAYLELMENSWLSGGVTVMARPPGKKLASIKLLSGGEKALAAMAVIFSIFELNPAPFCMLDEVDAPLDEDNVTRFCELIQEMSERVQFIIVTHNRITMERMNCLLGVTMGEPGVSNIVSVNVDEAIKIANA